MEALRRRVTLSARRTLEASGSHLDLSFYVLLAASSRDSRKMRAAGTWLRCFLFIFFFCFFFGVHVTNAMQNLNNAALG